MRTAKLSSQKTMNDKEVSADGTKIRLHFGAVYYNLLTSCALNEHLNDTERRANELEQMLTEQMAASEGVTENLKATDMMSWVRKMNSIRSRVQEIVMAEVIFA